VAEPLRARGIAGPSGGARARALMSIAFTFITVR
jgi:hypothetical protein